ncbi:MAG: hypothetical protein IJ039_03270 [Clostridia bacterium]|nr:hypothetical protein [Clostridia bacterium]
MKKLISIGSIAVILLAAPCLFGCSDDDGAREAFERYYNEKIALFEGENKEYEKNEVDVVFLGDSLTDGYDLEKFYPDYLTLNRGISGDTTVGLEKRLKVCAYDVQPKAVVMLIGANNMDSMLDNYESILSGFKENLPNSKIILLSLTSMSKEWGKKNQLAAYNNVQIKMLAQKYDYYYVDLYSALLNLETGEIYDEYTTDGGHLTDKGYTVLTENITPVLKEALEK